MLMVIWAHCGISGSPIINYFHMPLFFFISGYLFKERSFNEFLIKKVKSLYLPFAAYELLFLAFRNVFLSLNLYTTEEWSWMEPVTVSNLLDLLTHIFLFENIDELLSTLWFPMALFAVEILYFFLKRIITKDTFRLVISLALLIFGFFLCQEGITINYSYNFDKKISVILISVWFYCVGDYSRIKGIFDFREEYVCSYIKSRISKWKIVTMACLIAVMAAAYRLYFYTDYRACSFSNPLASLVLANVGIYVAFELCVLMYQLNCQSKFGEFINSRLQEVGVWAFHFMALQFLAMKPASFLIAKIMGKKPLEYVEDFGVAAIASQPLRLIAFVLVVIECYVVSIIIDRINICCLKKGMIE